MGCKCQVILRDSREKSGCQLGSVSGPLSVRSPADATAQVCLRGVRCAAWGLLREQNKVKGQRPLITTPKSCLKPERGSLAGMSAPPHTPSAGGPARPRRNAQRPSPCHTSEGAPETIPRHPGLIGWFPRVFCPSCVVPVVILSR